MEHGSPPSNQNLKQDQSLYKRRKSRISGYLSGRPKPIKAARVDPVEEKKQRLMWWLKWVIFLPLSAYMLMWMVVIIIDLFKY